MADYARISAILQNVVKQCDDWLLNIPVPEWTQADNEAMAQDIMEQATELKWLAYASKREHNS